MPSRQVCGAADGPQARQHTNGTFATVRLPGCHSLVTLAHREAVRDRRRAALDCPAGDALSAVFDPVCSL
jgi:hypothetical protein